MILIKYYKHEKIEFQIDVDCSYYCLYNWNAVKRGNKYYLYNGKNAIYYHRLIMGAKKGDIIDHIDRDSKNNLKSNLRVVTSKENSYNRTKSSSKYNSSVYIGVSFDTHSGKWKASININGKRKTIGRYTNEIDAAMAYNEAIIKYRPVFGTLNIIK